MLFDSVQIDKELQKKYPAEEAFLQGVNQLLQFLALRDEDTVSRLKSSTQDPLQLIIPKEEDFHKVHSLTEIERVCVKYRLRFLDAEIFTAEYPAEAIQAIHAFEDNYQIKIQSFKIIAPAEVFRLEEINKDPLLFASIGNGNYFLLHKWGRDLHWSRAIKNWPLRHFKNFVFSVVMASMIIAFAIPGGWFEVLPEKVMSIRLWLWAHFFIATFGFTIFLGSVLKMGFSDGNWESKKLNV